ncbi:MAG: zinc-dependent alcohol dehydrogenase [Trueperaceae bacterium]
MRAVTWHGTHDVRVERVPDPELLRPRDAIVRVTATAICGSDLHLYDGFIPTMKRGDILGHEFMGEVVEVGPEVHNLRPGDRVVVPFPIACGRCWFCRHDLWALCDNSNPNAPLAELFFGESPSGIFGYSHLMGGYAGGQAELVRVPFADVGPLTVPEGVSDDQALFLSDILPTGWMAAENCGLAGGETVAVWGCGPVGLFAITSALAQGAEQVVAIDRVPVRLARAAELGAVTIHYEQEDPIERLAELTGGRGPDACIEAVGMEAHGGGLLGPLDRVKQAARLETGRPHALRQAILACRKGGTLSLAGVFGGFIDTVPIGAAFNKGLTFRMGQTHVHRYLRPLLERIQRGEIDPTKVLTHKLSLDEAPGAYEMFRRKSDGCIKVVLTP